MLRPALLLAAALLAACASGDGPATTEAASGATPPSGLETTPPPPDATTGGANDATDLATADARPATSTGVVSLEGDDEVLDLRLVRYPDLPAPFSTYLPESWADDVVASGETTAVRFTMGEPPFQALLTISFPSGGAEAARAQARAILDGARDVQEPEVGEPWATFERAFVRDGSYGSVRVGEHAGVPFVVLEEVPFEMGDGFYPRAALVLDRLRWLDTGAGL